MLVVCFSLCGLLCNRAEPRSRTAKMVELERQELSFLLRGNGNLHKNLKQNPLVKAAFLIITIIPEAIASPFHQANGNVYDKLPVLRPYCN